MIKKNQKLFNFINKLIEITIIVVSYVIATYIRFNVMYLMDNTTPMLQIPWSVSYISVAIIYAIVLVAVYNLTGQFRSSRSFFTFSNRTARLIWINALGILIFAAFLYITRIADFSRIALFIFYIISTGLIIAKRAIVLVVLGHFREQGFNIKHVIVVGNGHLAKKYIDSVQNNPRFGFKVAGYVSAIEKEGLGECLGSYEMLEAILDELDVDEVVVALESHEMKFMPYMIYASEKAGVKLSIIPSYNDYIPSRPTIDVIDELKLIHIRSTPFDNPLNVLIKRFLDIIGSAVLIVILSPLLLIIAICIKSSSPGPVLFKQERVGLNKEIFTMYKFRSMKVNDTEETGWSGKVDSRKTKFGAFIRKFSLDELPQLFNVIKGDMSMIGPRPEVPYHVEHFKEEIPSYMLRQQVRPGMSGWAQINGLRGDTSITERIKYDIWYIENWSVALDIHIVFKTVFGGMINEESITNKTK